MNSGTVTYVGDPGFVPVFLGEKEKGVFFFHWSSAMLTLVVRDSPDLWSIEEER